MTTVHASSAVQIPRLQLRDANAQRVAQAETKHASKAEDVAFDGHIDVPSYLHSQLRLMKLIEEQRSANRAAYGKLGNVTQQMSLMQAQAVRNEGIDLFTGALLGAGIGLAVGGVGGVMSHRALSKQLGSANLGARGTGTADRSAALSRGDEVSGAQQQGHGASAQNAVSDIDSPSSLWDRLQMRCGGKSYSVQDRTRQELGDIDAATAASRRHPAVTPARLSSMPNAAPTTAGSIRRADSGAGDADVTSSTHAADALPAVVPAADPATCSTNVVSDAASFSPADMLRVSRSGAVGQTLAGNAASLGTVASSGGQMAASTERANAGLLQASGMTSESAKNNRGDEARGDNEAIAQMQATLRQLNQMTQQTMSQIASSIRA
ncbi:MAG: hypothetical protein WDN30_14760 [Pararobbsia sp.]